MEEDEVVSVGGVRTGDVLAGKYRVEKVLGVGGMGVVVAAYHIQLDQRVALKFLLPEMLHNKEAVTRFAREAQAAVRIKSEHVARVTDVGTLPNGAPYMVMEYLEGGDLSGWLKQRGRLPIEQAVEFVLQASVAVADAHALGIVHRDLKPANLFCVRRSDGKLSVKVLDFGISKMTTNSMLEGSGTRTSAMMGSPYYMSPEQMRSSKDVDARTDIWALGVILYELLAGTTPFESESVVGIALKVTVEPPPPLRAVRPDVPPELEAVILAALEKERDQRYPTVAKLATALLPFAPARCVPLVERITDIISTAGLSPTMPPPPMSATGGLPVNAKTGGSGARSAVGLAATEAVDMSVPLSNAVMRRDATLHPVQQTMISSSATSKRRVVAVGLVAVVAGVGGILAGQHNNSAPQNAPAAAAAPARAPSVAEPAPTPTLPAAANGNSAADPAAPLPAPPPPPAAPVAPVVPGNANANAPSPGAVAPPKTSSPPPAAAVNAAPRAAATAPLAAPANRPAAASCNPPYYFDAKGARVYKKECL